MVTGCLHNDVAVLWGRRFRPYPSGVTEGRWPWVFVSVTREALGPAKGCSGEGLGRGEENSFLFLDLAVLGPAFEESSHA